MVSDIDMIGAAQGGPMPSVAVNEYKQEPEQSEKDFVTSWLSKIDAAKKYHSDDFDRMRECIMLANGLQWPGQAKGDERYIANIIKRIIKRRVAALYAKNPTVVPRRKPRMDFTVWDGTQAMLSQAMMNPADPFNQQILQDATQGAQWRKSLDRIAKTLELVFRYELDEQEPNFKRQMKQLVRRMEITGVGYVRLDFHREMDVHPDAQAALNDLARELSTLESMIAEHEEASSDAPAIAEAIKQKMQSLESRKYILKREGLIFSFPKSTAVIPDQNCYDLEGFQGARWLAEEFYMDEAEIYRVYKKEINNATRYSQVRMAGLEKYDSKELYKWNPSKGDKSGHYCVYVVYDKDTTTSFAICRGYDGYLKPPSAPKFTLKRFFPYYALAPNQLESEGSIFPDSTVWDLRHQQAEYNRAKEALRQHRIAMRPLYVNAVGALGEDDKKNMASHEAHDCIEISTLNEGESVDNKFQQVKKHAIDPNVYETSNTLQDMNLISGTQPANLSVPIGVTATESSLAEDSRVSDLASDADDIDDFLNAIVSDAGQIILSEYSEETVKKISGPGASWPQFSLEDVMKNIYLEIVAGSAGRPNKAADQAALRNNMPFVLQLPGMNPEFWGKKLAESTFDNIDLEDAYTEGLPSIIAMNAQKQLSTGNPASDPNAQGPQGANTDPAARAEAVTGRGVGGQAIPLNPGATAADAAGQKAGGMMV